MPSINRVRLILLLSVSVIHSAAMGIQSGECTATKPRTTPFGVITFSECGSEQQAGYRYFVSVNGKKVLQDSYLSKEDFDPLYTRWIYRGSSSPKTGCADRLYLVDLSTQPTTVLAFGIKTACNEFEWASWGDKRSVIALKHNVKFVYENGKLVPPRVGTKLFNSIEPPHSSVGGGMTADSAVPFVESVPLPDTP